MMRYQRAVLTFIAALALFAGGNYLIWKCWTETLLSDRQYQGGDLARMGYIDTSKQLRRDIDDLPRRHVKLKNYVDGSFDVVTIGDSFSNGGAGGRNRFYQDYLASISGKDVLNIPPYKDLDPLSSVSIMLNSGFLETLHPRYVLISMHEWGYLPALASTLDFSTTPDREVLNRLKHVDYHVPHPVLTFINDGNLKFVLNKLLYLFSDHAFFSRVHKRKLSQALFSAPDNSSLLFLRIKTTSDGKALRSLNNNLNALAERLSARGIILVFMPCVDKYNLYSDYIVNNPYPRSNFFEELRTLPKRYRFIDTKAILSEELRKGEKDIFYADDTHWGWKASKIIFEKVRLE